MHGTRQCLRVVLYPNRRSDGRFRTSLVTLLFVILSWSSLGLCQFPVIYPSPSANGSTVEDMSAGELFPGHAAFHLFVCSPRTQAQISLPCPHHLRVNSRTQRVTLRVSWVDASHQFVALPSEIHIQVFAELQPPFGRPIHERIVERHGQIHLQVNLLMQVQQVPVYVQATVQDKSTGVIVAFDMSPPTVDIWERPVVEEKSTEPYLTINIQVDERAVPAALYQNHECLRYITSPLLEMSYTIADLFEISVGCPPFRIADSIRRAVTVIGGRNHSWLSVSDTLVARIGLNASKPENISVTVSEGQVLDFAGNKNTENASLMLYYRPTVGVPSTMRHQGLLRRRVELKALAGPGASTAGKLIGSMATAAVGGTMAASSAGGGASAGGGQSFPIFLLNLIQKLYLSGHIGVENMPEVYADFSTQLAWAMFDFPSPFESFVSKSSPSEDDEASDGGGTEDVSYWNSVDGAYLYMARVLFWVPLIFLLLLLLHGSLLSICFFRKKRIPFILTFPRLEIMFCYWAMPALTVACAGLLRGNRMDALFGVWLLVLFPGSMVTWNLLLLWRYFYSKDPRQRLAHFVVESSSVPERTLVQLKNEWQHGRMMKKQTRLDPPVVFINGAFDQSMSPKQRPLPPVAILDPPLKSAKLSDDALAGPFGDSMDYSSDPSYAQTPREDREEWRGEIQPLYHLQHQGPSSASRMSSFQSRNSEPSTSSGFRNNGYTVHRGWDAASTITPRQSTEVSSLGRDALDTQPFSAIPISSSDTSANDYADELLSTGPIQMKTVTDRLQQTGTGMIFGGRSKDKRGWLKYGASERFQDGTSNNVAALTMQPELVEIALSGAGRSTTPSPRYRMTYNEMRLSFDNWGSGLQDGLYGRQRSLEMDDAEVPQTSTAPRSKPPEWMKTWALTCAAIPEPEWKSQLWSNEPLSKGDVELNIPDTTGLHTPRQRLQDDGRLSVIAENAGQRSSASLWSGPTGSSSQPGAHSRDTNEATTRGERRPYNQNDFVDNQLGISVIRPDPYYETGARLKHINNEVQPRPTHSGSLGVMQCLMDMGLDYLVTPETESSEDERSDVEYEVLAKGSVQPQRRLTFWRACGDLCDMGLASLVMGGRQLRGRWVDSPYSDDTLIYKYGYLFEDFRGLPVLYRPPTYEVVNRKMDRGKFIPLRLRPLFRCGGWKLPGLQCSLPKVALYHHQLQLLARFLQLARIMLLGASVASIGTGRDCLPQILILLGVCLLLLIVVRVARPFRSRLEMAIALSEEASDVLFLTLAALLLMGPSNNDNFRQQVGMGMLTAECGSLAAILLNRLVLATKGFVLMLARHKKRQPTKLSRLFRKYLLRNVYFLQRKYFDRWMVIALKRGLYNRPPKREELPIAYVINTQLTTFHGSLVWWRLEVQSVWTDFCKKVDTVFRWW